MYLKFKILSIMYSKYKIQNYKNITFLHTLPLLSQTRPPPQPPLRRDWSHAVATKCAKKNIILLIKVCHTHTYVCKSHWNLTYNTNYLPDWKWKELLLLLQWQFWIVGHFGILLKYFHIQILDKCIWNTNTKYFLSNVFKIQIQNTYIVFEIRIKNTRISNTPQHCLLWLSLLKESI